MLVNNLTVNLDELVCDTFSGIFTEIVNAEIDRAVLNGGRNSTKSQVVSEAIVTGVMNCKESAVCMVRHANKIEDRLVNTFKFTIELMGVEKWWKLRRSPFEYVLLDDAGRETNVSIKFTGCDVPDDIKSFKPRSGSFRYIWFEEVSNFRSINEVNNIIQTMARGKGKHVCIFTYNPPKSAAAWPNKEWSTFGEECKPISYSKDRKTFRESFEVELYGKKYTQIQVVHHSTYLDVIASGHADWLGSAFIAEAEKSKVENPTYYNWAYLGEVAGSEATVFPNVRDWDSKVPEESKQWCKRHYRGFDFGYGGPDTNAFTEWVYDEKNKYLFLFHEFGDPKMSLELIAENLIRVNPKCFPVKSDSANPLLVSSVNNLLPAEQLFKVKKPQGSVRAGVMWLQSLNGIFIDKLRCPKSYKEFKEYEYVIDKDDVVTPELPDKENHFIDSTRYAMYEKIKYN